MHRICGFAQLKVSAYCTESRPIISGDGPSTMSNYNVIGWLLMSMNVTSKKPMMSLELAQCVTQPCRYELLDFCILRLMIMR